MNPAERVGAASAEEETAASRAVAPPRPSSRSICRRETVRGAGEADIHVLPEYGQNVNDGLAVPETSSASRQRGAWRDGSCTSPSFRRRAGVLGWTTPRPCLASARCAAKLHDCSQFVNTVQKQRHEERPRDRK